MNDHACRTSATRPTTRTSTALLRAAGREDEPPRDRRRGARRSGSPNGARRCRAANPQRTGVGGARGRSLRPWRRWQSAVGVVLPRLLQGTGDADRDGRPCHRDGRVSGLPTRGQLAVAVGRRHAHAGDEIRTAGSTVDCAASR